MSWIDEHEGQLTTRLKQLRDGSDNGPSPHTANRRQARISEMEKDHLLLQQVLDEMEQYREYALDAPCKPDLVQAMDRVIAREVAKVRGHAVQLHAAMSQLKGTTR